MKKNYNKHSLLIFSGVFMLLVIWGCWILYTNKSIEHHEAFEVNADQTLVKVHSCWRSYTLEEAVGYAAVIVRGKVLEKSETKTQDIIDTNGEVRGQNYYKEVTVEVLEGLKGAADNTTITYVEPGGETESVLCIYEDVVPLSVGEEYIFILTEDGCFFNPATILPIKSETVTPAMSLQYSNDALVRTDNGDDVPVAVFVNAIREMLRK